MVERAAFGRQADHRRRHQGCRVRLASGSAPCPSSEPWTLGGAKFAHAGQNRANHLLREPRQHGAVAWLHQKDAEDTSAGDRSRPEAHEGSGVMKKKNIGSSFDDWLHEESIYEEVTAVAIKRVLARQISQKMAEQKLSKTDMARRM